MSAANRRAALELLDAAIEGSIATLQRDASANRPRSTLALAERAELVRALAALRAERAQWMALGN